MRTLFNNGWTFHRGELKHPVEKINTKTGTCGGPSNLTAEEGFVYRLHPYMAKKMRMENANSLYHVAEKLEDDFIAVQLPHDWSVLQPYVSPKEGNGTSREIERGYLEPEVGYYRKRFAIPKEAEGRRIILEFEGVMRDATVWVNGCYIGEHLSGYTGFACDISEYLFYGEEGENVVLVRADTSLNEGWWAEGAGIYRDVWLRQCESVHIRRNGIFVYSGNVSEQAADVHAKVIIENDAFSAQDILVKQKILSPDGDVAAEAEQKLKAEGMECGELAFTFHLEEPKLWDLNRPDLYVLTTEVIRDGEILEREETSFGIRTVRYTENGLLLNGKTVEIKGVCVHQDFAGVGVALTRDLIRYRLEKIKAMGANAYRSAHHPATEALLQECDRMGILVLNENRRFECSKEGIADLTELVESSRNHPCIFMWSLENEELISTLPNGKRILKRLAAYTHKLDPTRQCTVAGHYACRDEEYVKIPDVAGFNYDMDDAEAMREKIPGLLTAASEDGSFISARGVYEDDRTKGWCDSYDSGSYMKKLMMEKMGIRELPAGTLGGASSPNDLVYSWNQYKEKAPFLGGMFVWSAFDYRGETFPWNWPAVRSQYGAMDMCGFEKDTFYYWKSLWTEEPLVHLLPHWNQKGREGQAVQVDVYSNCPEVELFLNGRSLGRKRHIKGKITSWNVEYVPGELRAAAYESDGKQAAADVRVTAESPENIRFTGLYDGERECLIRAEITDANGTICPLAENRVTFRVEGGRIAGTGNGNPSDHEPEQSASRHAFGGLLLVIVEKDQDQTSDGKIELTACADWSQSEWKFSV